MEGGGRVRRGPTPPLKAVKSKKNLKGWTGLEKGRPKITSTAPPRSTRSLPAMSSVATATATATPAQERTRYLNTEYNRIQKELDQLYEPYSEEWSAAFEANPIIHEWRADWWNRMNARMSISKGW